MLIVRILPIVVLLGTTHAQADDQGIIARLLTSSINAAGILSRLFPRYPDTGYRDNDEFDFIIVGAGPTGAVLANRLSEQKNWKILLLEAGQEPSPITEVPFLCGALEFSKYNWGYKTEPQPGFCRGCTGHRLEYPHGKGLGGSTILNYMIYVRGNRLDYDRWEAMGNPGWSYKEIFPYLLKSEDADIAINDTGYHSKGGYLGVSDVKHRSKAVEAFVQAAQEAGYPYVDYNGKSQIGVSYVQSTTKHGVRVSSENAFLRPIRNRKNLVIRTSSLVTRVLIEPRSKKAYGVEYSKNGKLYKAIARKEVIVSAGSLNSPQVLMLSGIGPRKHLEELGIPVIRDAPVGEIMYDHPTFAALTFTLNDTRAVHNLFEFLGKISIYKQYLNNGSGPLASIGGVEALAYIRTNASDDPDPSVPDIELLFVGGSLSSDNGILHRRQFNIPKKMYDVVWKPLEGKPVFQIFPLLFHPKSKGYIKLRSKNPFDAPKFYVNYLSDPKNHDVKTFIAAIREIQRITSSPALKRIGTKLWDTPIPGCGNYTYNTDEYWECAIRTVIGTLYHQVATCKMGPPEDKEAVVDARLRVYGVRNLRVADTSIIPRQVTAHTVEPAYLVGEKGADIIKQDWEMSVVKCFSRLCGPYLMSWSELNFPRKPTCPLLFPPANYRTALSTFNREAALSGIRQASANHRRWNTQMSGRGFFFLYKGSTVDVVGGLHQLYLQH